MQLLCLILKGKVDLLDGPEIVFGIEEPLSIFSMHTLPSLDNVGKHSQLISS
jgi:hypothetical protein